MSENSTKIHEVGRVQPSPACASPCMHLEGEGRGPLIEKIKQP